ncbi:leucine--tRNA ligase [Candidatus Pacearchaeota archaeon]|nr:leucine--tRNA ligase [Candidatus Pacearchaeota archaeon]
MSKSIYNHQAIEEKWAKVWEEGKLFQDTSHGDIKDKLYLLFAFAYPSGSGLHVGHVESKTALDILARYNRMNGKDVFFPVGWDAFGLPAENYAIKTGTPPEETTKEAMATFGRQLRRIGISYDWENEIATCEPTYYKWTQWIFLQLFNKGLAYQATGKVNWCPSCQTVLANEQVIDGHCERCDHEVVQKDMKQWYFKITEYKDELIDGLNDVDWPEPTKQQQINWIGRSEGVEIDFSIKDTEQKITCFTTRVDTISGVSFIVLSPEKFTQLGLEKNQSDEFRVQTSQYVTASMKRTEEERKIGEKNKTGVDTGLKAINPVTKEEIPIWVADYVLAGYGTGAVMGVPAHDKRDRAFAEKFGFEITQVIDADEETAYGTLINSGKYDGLSSKEAMEKIPNEFSGQMVKTKNYRLRDWLISRQRYWGAPIPIVYDPEGKPHPVKQEHLPWKLPTDVDFKPTGESPLKSSVEFKKRVEDLYGQGWTPEYDTMDTFVDSSWYYLRYTDTKNQEIFASKEQMSKWMPVDFYMIGPEHIVLHLLYSRFFTKFLRDEGHLNFSEPFMKMRHQGMILGPDGKKMSKSKGNVINPDDVVDKFGADTLRVYEMFMGPIETDKPWDERSVVGVHRFLRRIYDMVIDESNEGSSSEVVAKLHKTIKKVTQDIPDLKFNTAIAAMMEFINVWESHKGGLNREEKLKFIQLLAPFAPFFTEEMWCKVNKETIHTSNWPEYDESLAKDQEVILPVQVNGKVRAELVISSEELESLSKEDIFEKLAELDRLKKWIDGKEVRKKIYVPGKIVNLVVT